MCKYHSTAATEPRLSCFLSPLECKLFRSRSRTNFILRTYDNSAGDKGELGHNTDAFDVGSSENILISGAIVHNQESVPSISYRFPSSIFWNITGYIAT